MRFWTAAWLIAMACQPMAARAATLTIEVDDVRSDGGRIFVCLFSQPAGFPACDADAGVAARAVQPAHAPVTVFQFDRLPPGTYATSSFHDEAGSGRIETNLFGIPRNGVGASRDARGRFGPPAFADAAFTMGKLDERINMRLVYP